MTADLTFDTCDRLPPIGLAERQAMLAGPGDRCRHDRLYDEIATLHRTETGPPPVSSPGPIDTAHVLFWNVERGRYLTEAAALIAAQRADVNLLCELDCGMARSFQRHTPRELASRTGQGYAFAVEFVELGLGDSRERAWHAGEENEAGLHGGAILSPRPLERPGLIRLERDGHWFDGSRGERRVGGRIAQVATLNVAGIGVACVVVHLESHSDPDHRAAQMRTLLTAVDAYAPGGPVIIGGDFNTSSGPREALAAPGEKSALAVAEPDRFVDPVRHEPLFAVARDAGYDWTACNAPGPTQRTRRDGTPAPPLGRLDWFFTRGLVASDPATLPAIDGNGETISDHDALVVTIRPAG